MKKRFTLISQGAVAELMEMNFARDDATMKIEKILIDANWGDSTDVVYSFCESSPHASIIHPSHGQGIGPGAKPFNEGTKKAGEKSGMNWRMPPVHTGRKISTSRSTRISKSLQQLAMGNDDRRQGKLLAVWR